MSENRQDPGGAARRAPVDASMTLLNEVMHRPLDPGYADAAARRAAGQAPHRGRTGTVVLVALAVALGVVTTAAAVELRAPQPGVIAARETLEQEILDRQGAAEELAARGAELSAEIEQLQGAALSGASADVLQGLQAEGALTGTQAVEGQGVVVTLDDTSGGLSSDTVDSSSLVHDSDLQRVVNALWAGGAEAVAINDQRLTGLSAIRSAGDAVLVDLQPLVGPYRVEAIGDPDALRTSLLRSGTSDYLQILGTQYGIRSSVTTQSRLDLPGRPAPTLFFAKAPAATVDSDTPAGSTDGTTDGTTDGSGTGPEPHETGQEIVE
ncbi:DUF881 domain-containing protein [Cellulosimicrobium cellulans]|uniref:DUF881 domain-containing protein n=1 Tax=Cellulosimicrobium cellulans TaxID=1710 RepID=UPI00209712F8|nr:DUF881 domain-containing protein [Cellulosimicrobium cellulans]MCO7271760.1 DUF881 domain-containing protein [Cellulosimicrobium cellulans]